MQKIGEFINKILPPNGDNQQRQAFLQYNQINKIYEKTNDTKKRKKTKKVFRCA